MTPKIDPRKSQPMRFAQGTHLAALVAALGICYLYFPHGQTKPQFLLTFIHLAAFSTYFGAQIWTTFVTGVVLSKRIARHTFGEVQSHLFPKYFQLGTAMSLILGLSYMTQHPYSSWTQQDLVQVVSFGVSFLCNVGNIYCTDVTLQVMDQYQLIERESGHGHEIGFHKFPELEENGEYQRLRKRFITLHGISSIMNLLALVGSGIHMYYLASNVIHI